MQITPKYKFSLIILIFLGSIDYQEFYILARLGQKQQISLFEVINFE